MTATLPPEVQQVFARFITTEFTSIDRRGQPITWPLTPYYRPGDPRAGQPTMQQLRASKQLLAPTSVQAAGGDAARVEVAEGADVTLTGTMNKPVNKIYLLLKGKDGEKLEDVVAFQPDREHGPHSQVPARKHRNCHERSGTNRTKREQSPGLNLLQNRRADKASHHRSSPIE